MEDISWIIETISASKGLTIPVTVVLVSVIFKDSIKTFINFYINKKQGNGTDLVKRFDTLEQKANHEHSVEIAGIKEDIGQIRADVSHLSTRIEKISNKVSRIEGKISGGFHPQ